MNSHNYINKYKSSNFRYLSAEAARSRRLTVIYSVIARRVEVDFEEASDFYMPMHITYVHLYISMFEY